jgi:hypothetical protein
MDARPPNPTPSGRQAEVTGEGNAGSFVQKQQRGPGINVRSSNLRVSSSRTSSLKVRQPSISDLLRSNLISIEGDPLRRTPSISELMDFDISPGDLVPDQNVSIVSPPNNNKTEERKAWKSKNSPPNSFAMCVQTSPLRLVGGHKNISESGAVYSTWNTSEERKRAAENRGHQPRQAHFHFQARPPSKPVSSKPGSQSPNRPVSNTVYTKPSVQTSKPEAKLAMDFSIPSASQATAVDTDHANIPNIRRRFHSAHPSSTMATTISVTGHSPTYQGEEIYHPPRPAPPHFSGRKSAWDSSGSDDDSEMEEGVVRSTNDEGTAGVEKRSNGNDLSMPANGDDLGRVQSARASSVSENTIPPSSSQVDMVCAKIIRLCLNSEDTDHDTLEHALVLYERLTTLGVVLKLPGVYKHLIIRCNKEKKIAQALEVFEDMFDAHVEVCVEVWESVNAALVQGGMLEKAAAMLSKMRWGGVTPKPEFFVITILACISIGQVDLADALLSNCDEIPLPYLNHMVEVCTALLSQQTAVGYRAQETSLLEFIARLDFFIGLKNPGSRLAMRDHGSDIEQWHDGNSGVDEELGEGVEDFGDDLKESDPASFEDLVL